jgi:hypothetical protein
VIVLSNAQDHIRRFLAVILLQAPIAATVDAQVAPPAALPPEIVAALPSGEYTGRARGDGKGFDVSLVIQQTKPGGRFTGTVVVHKAPHPCDALFPISGEISTGGAVRIDSRQGVAQGCERAFDLKLAGDQLTGTLVDARGSFQVDLKKQ